MNARLSNSPATNGQEHVFYPHNDPKGTHDILIVTKGDGARVRDAAGKSYIEGVAGLWCTSLGFSNERLVKAAHEQLQTLPFYQASSYKSHPKLIELAAKLLSVAPSNMDKVIFGNSGSEANDSAIKLIWYYNNARGKPQKKKLIGRVNGYHGISVASGSLTGINYNHQCFDLPIDRFFHVMEPHYYRNALPGESEEDFATRCAKQLENLILREGADTVAAMFLEPVTGAGGVVVPPRTYAEKIQAVLRRYDVLLVADEVVCGFGRIGEYWGHQAFGLKPDLLTCAKALSSGYMPISALMISKQIMDSVNEQAHRIGGFAHSPTYFGHPVAAAVALETLTIYQEMDVVNHVRRLGEILQSELRAKLDGHPVVGQIRGMGLLAAVELVSNKDTRAHFDPKRKLSYRLQDICTENGLILRGFPFDTIGICPPYVIKGTEVTQLVDTLACSIDQLAQEIASGKA